ncbi:hypothetical protein EJ07DRAFT_182565 [Lizonia empirigonia]|nr:hypothetical protein EJ07DRAFT_182565 [Lizonia empirigonia]
MVCREEHVTDTNTAGLSTILCDLRLERIARIWQDRCTRKYNIWVDEYNRRTNEAIAQTEADDDFIEKFTAWWYECQEVSEQLQELILMFQDNKPVTPADWDAAIAGKERKAFAVLAPWYPRETWPQSVPYLNLIARELHEEEEQHLQKQHYMKKYHVAMENIKKRGEAATETKRAVEETSDSASFETPLTETQVRGYQSVEKRRLETDKAQFFADAEDIVLGRMHGQPVLDKDWDVKAWAGTVLEDSGLVATDEAKDHVVQSVKNAIERWPRHAELIHETDDEVDMTDNQGNEGEFFLPYDV